MIHARVLVQTFETKQGRTKTEVRAVDDVDLDVAKGEVVGFLGPTGAGKTTTLRMLTTLLRRSPATTWSARPSRSAGASATCRRAAPPAAPRGRGTR